MAMGLGAQRLWFAAGLKCVPLSPRTGLIIDARVKGNLARLLNSSCDPNCETQKWHDAGNGEVGGPAPALQLPLEAPPADASSMVLVTELPLAHALIVLAPQ